MQDPNEERTRNRKDTPHQRPRESETGETAHIAAEAVATGTLAQEPHRVAPKRAEAGPDVPYAKHAQLDRTGSERSRLEWIGSDRIGLERTGSDWIGQDRTGSDGIGLDRTEGFHGRNVGLDRTGLDWIGPDRTRDALDHEIGNGGWDRMAIHYRIHYGSDT